MRFAGKTAVITGAASGIGRATAIRLAGEGAVVFAADVDEGGGRALAASSNGDLRFQRCDVTQVPDIAAAGSTLCSTMPLRAARARRLMPLTPMTGMPP